MSNSCPKVAKCPLFNGTLLKRKQSEEIYKNLYCNSAKNFVNCKRFIVSEKVGKAADFVMPNSSYSVEEIIAKMKREGILV